jgi:hypothetical protein
MQSISQKLVEETKKFNKAVNEPYSCSIHITSKIKQHAETCEAILKEIQRLKKGVICSKCNQLADTEITWLESEIKILKDAKLV